MRFTHINEEELNIVAAKAVIEFVDSANGGRGHGACGGAKDQQNVLLLGEIAQANGLAIQGYRLEIGRSLARPGAGEGGLCQILKKFAGKVLVVVTTEAQHFCSYVPRSLRVSISATSDALGDNGIRCRSCSRCFL